MPGITIGSLVVVEVRDREPFFSAARKAFPVCMSLEMVSGLEDKRGSRYVLCR